MFHEATTKMPWIFLCVVLFLLKGLITDALSLRSIMCVYPVLEVRHYNGRKIKKLKNFNIQMKKEINHLFNTITYYIFILGCM